MKPKLSIFALTALLASVLFYCCRKPAEELNSPASAKVGLLNQTSTTTAVLTSDPVIIYYVGDLSVSLAATGQFKLDSCTKLVKVFYNVTIKNTNGNSKFSFDVQFFKNGTGTTFYYTDGSTKDNGRARIETLNINETRTISGYIQTPYVAPNTETSNAFELKGQITELLAQPIDQTIYKIKTDLTPRNNVSTVQTTLPYFAFSKTVFDDLAIATMSGNGTMSGYQAVNPLGGNVPNYAPFALSAAYPNVNLVLVGWGLSQIGVEFIKAGCLPVSGKPFYYMKSHGKYLTYWLGSGVVLTDPTPTNESMRRWVFTPAPRVDNTPGASYYIYNMSLGKNFRLQVRSLVDPQVNDTPVNFIGIGTPDPTIKQQVFVLN